MPEFRGNRNLTDDLVNFEQTFRRAIEVATVLGVDESLRKQWQNALEKLPPIKYTWDGQQGTVAFGYSEELGYVDNDPYYLSPYLKGKWKSKEEIPMPYESTSLWMVYPFEYLTEDGDTPLDKAAYWRIRNMYGYTKHPNPRDESHSSVPYGALLRVEGKKWYEHTIRTIESLTLPSGGYYLYFGGTPKDSGTGRMPEFYVHPIQYITDILLQTQGGVIRLFPALPDGKLASFSGFLARNGFRVSAQADGKTIRAQIESKLGNTCCVKIDNRCVVEAPEGAWEENGKLFFATQPGCTYDLVMQIDKE